ncbi:MAG: hypothetical protein DRI90_05300 [Deltaproteobacteria bacterium]|nr:MAG: hypothetical protein DRI90_05300 [Deltaproteobacteria bacterium]
MGGSSSSAHFFVHTPMLPVRCASTPPVGGRRARLVWGHAPLLVLAAAAVGCGPTVEEPAYAGPPNTAMVTSVPPVPSVAIPLPVAVPDAGPLEPKLSVPSPCPDDMQFVDTVHCPDTRFVRVGLTCLRKDSNNPNHLTICHEFRPGQRCHVDRRRQRYCIDRYEFPNAKNAHPPVMVSAYDAAGLCAEQGKRMCWESEWTAACEGPDLKPFPYGYQRSGKHCNIDNPYRHPNLDKVHHPKDSVRGPELIKLDQSVLSGAMETCKSDFGVYDLTGNFDEWVLTERPRGKSKWAGLKGGAWGYVRNACRPITTSHAARWSYYFISFRCCKDADSTAMAPPPDDGVALWKPPPLRVPKHPGRKPLDRGWTPPAQ